MQLEKDAGGKTDQSSEYQRKIKRLNFLLLLVLLSWLPEAGSSGTPLVDILLSTLIASVFVLLYSFFQFRIEKKYRQVTASQRDYLISNLPFYVIALVPSLATILILNGLPKLGYLSIVYVDIAIVLIYVLVARYPFSIRLGQRATLIKDETLLSSFRELSNKMGVQNVQLYSIDWSKFKIANAFQAGPSKFSVYVSNYLTEKMTKDEVLAVMAHELAHAKRRHVAKSLSLYLFSALIAIDLLILGGTLPQSNLLGIISILSGIALIFIGSQIALRFQRKFELEADEIAARTIGSGKPMINALQRLVELNLISKSKGSPTHPSVTARVNKIEHMTPA